MKNNIIILVTLFSLGLLSSCAKLDIENPNGGQEPNFATAREGAAYTYTGEFARLSAMFTQQLQGNDLHYSPVYDKYLLTDSKLLNSYNTAYRHGVSLALDKNDDEGKLIAALIYSVTIEYFDNAERYVARGESPTPLTYNDILTLISEIGGDYATEAKMLKARVYLNQGKFTEALAALPTTMSDEDGYYVVHAGSSRSMNEWPLFQISRGGYLTPDKNIYHLDIKISNYTFLDGDTLLAYPIPKTVKMVYEKDTITVLTSQTDTFSKGGLMVEDPRLETYYGDGTVLGFPMTSNEKAYLISYAEALFIKAEAELETGANAQASFTEALTAAFKSAGVDGTAYIAANGTLDTDKAKAKEQIMTQKYLYMFGHPMVFVDYKRTKLPKITEKQSNFPDKWHYYYQ